MIGFDVITYICYLYTPHRRARHRERRSTGKGKTLQTDNVATYNTHGELDMYRTTPLEPSSFAKLRFV